MSSALEFWTGEGGDKYIDRNAFEGKAIAQRAFMFERILDRVNSINRVLEVGANVGINIAALQRILPPHVRYYAVEPNEAAFRELSKVVQEASCTTADNIPLPNNSIDVVFTSGVLIHIEPEKLLASCREIVRVAKRYVIAAEYFAAQPDRIDYRGSYIWKRDFGQFYLDNFPELRPVDCGFEWKVLTGIDNITWWVFEKC